METKMDRLLGALILSACLGSQSRMRAHLRAYGVEGLSELRPLVSADQRAQLEQLASALETRGVDVCLLGDDLYPKNLASTSSAPAVLYWLGNKSLFTAPSIGMCGSRNCSDQGLRAATACGEEVAAHGLAIVSGYAKGVDSQTHLAALRNDGCTIIVLAEGIDHFRVKRMFHDTGLPLDRVLIVSQFSPSQRWTVGGAMTRNGVIAGLARALVVIEAGESGGTLNAGMQALAMGRQVVALEFTSSETPAGNRKLLEQGASSIRTRKELGKVLDGLKDVVACPPADEARML